MPGFDCILRAFLVSKRNVVQLRILFLRIDANVRERDISGFKQPHLCAVRVARRTRLRRASSSLLRAQLFG